MKCDKCRRDLNFICQDNMSSNPKKIICEDCYYGLYDFQYNSDGCPDDCSVCPDDYCVYK